MADRGGVRLVAGMPALVGVDERRANEECEDEQAAALNVGRALTELREQRAQEGHPPVVDPADARGDPVVAPAPVADGELDLEEPSTCRSQGEQLAQPGPRVAAAPFDGLDGLVDEALLPGVEQSVEQRLTVGEVVVEAALGDAELLGERLDPDGARAARGEQSETALEPGFARSSDWCGHDAYATVCIRHRMEWRSTMTLPPGQWAVDGFPRFGAALDQPPPSVPPGSAIEVVSLAGEEGAVTADELATLPRVELEADFHCVAGWTALALRWEGVRMADVLRPRIGTGAERPAYVVLEGHDGYRAVVALEDALGDDVLLADRLDGEPLTPEHGAPLRVVSPQQYGFVSVKHLRRIELHATEPRLRYHPVASVDRGLRLVKPHRRARVWREERHRYLPAWVVRRVYRFVVPRLAPRVAPGRAVVDTLGADR